tara:strand:- start:136 stop:840 length:705 start_codon:yes stop_codon:yes gene_type:complete
MKIENNFDTYLLISHEKFVISVNQKKNFETIFKKEKLIDNDINQFRFKNLIDFLEENIFQIEKILNNFINNVYVIVDNNEFFEVEISLKQNNFNELILDSKLKHLLNEARSQCMKTIEGNKIIHMLIESYKLDNNSYSYLPTNLKCNSFSLDIRFINLSEKFIKDLEKVLKNYQISVNQFISAEYVRRFSNNEDFDLFKMSMNIIKGYNKNEVKFIGKTRKNKGFFEKFFDFFS